MNCLKLRRVTLLAKITSRLSQRSMFFSSLFFSLLLIVVSTKWVPSFVEEGHTANLVCEPNTHLTLALKSWSKVHPISLTLKEKLFTLSQRNIDDERYYIDKESYNLTIVNSNIVDDGYYHGYVFSTTKKKPLKSCIIRLVVFINPDLDFKIEKGPYEENHKLNIECTVPRIHPAPDPPSLFNVTFQQRNSSFMTTEISHLSEGGCRLSVHVSIDTLLEYDGDLAICQVTTALGSYFKKERELEIYVTGTLNLTTRRGPYAEGQNIDIGCEVPRTKGNISTNNLQVYVDEKELNGVNITENSDTTKRLSFHQTIKVTPEVVNTKFGCKYISPFGLIQYQFIPITLDKLTHIGSNHLWEREGFPSTIGSVFGGVLIVGLVVCGGLKCLRKRKRRKRYRQCKPSKLRPRKVYSQYDKINESEIQEPEIELPRTKDSNPTQQTSQQKQDQVTSSEDSEGQTAQVVQEPRPPRGKDFAEPYMIKVFDEDDGYDDTALPQTSNEQDKKPDTEDNVPEDYISIISTSSEESEVETIQVVQERKPPRGKDFAEPYMIKVFDDDDEYDDTALPQTSDKQDKKQEPKYVNECVTEVTQPSTSQKGDENGYMDMTGQNVKKN